MSNKQYLKTLNKEIEKLNGIIDIKIMTSHDYKREATRHKKLLMEIRRSEVKKSFGNLFRTFVPTRY